VLLEGGAPQVSDDFSEAFRVSPECSEAFRVATLPKAEDFGLEGQRHISDFV
jgi:hypothetical protein